MSPDPETGDYIVPWDELPPALRQRIGAPLPLGHAIWACRCRVRGGWFKPDRVVTEYWWIDDRGKVVDVF